MTVVSDLPVAALSCSIDIVPFWANSPITLRWDGVRSSGDRSGIVRSGSRSRPSGSGGPAEGTGATRRRPSWRFRGRATPPGRAGRPGRRAAAPAPNEAGGR